MILAELKVQNSTINFQLKTVLNILNLRKIRSVKTLSLRILYKLGTLRQIQNSPPRFLVAAGSDKHSRKHQAASGSENSA